VTDHLNLPSDGSESLKAFCPFLNAPAVVKACVTVQLNHRKTTDFVAQAQ